MQKQVDVVIVGTGTAALAAASEVRKVTDSFVIASNGVYGTTCVRAGCMPSKVFIQGAQLYHSRKRMGGSGITGVDALRMDTAALMARVRSMREHFLSHTLKLTEKYRAHIVEGDVWFLSPTDIRVNKEVYNAASVVIATGSSPIVPEVCDGYDGKIITSDTLFEQETLPEAMTVMGMSVLGTELAQAFARLGIRVSATHDAQMIGGLSDPEVNAYALQYLRQEMDIKLAHPPEHCLKCAQGQSVFVAQSRKANLDNMGLEDCGVIEANAPVVNYNPRTMQVRNLSVFVAGDVKLGRSLLNEAVDEGKIAGYNAAHPNLKVFRRRTAMQITYTEPTIAVVGKAWEELEGESTLAGKATYNDQGRAKIIGEPHGIVRIYADNDTQTLVGAELFAPEGEHLAHMLAWLVDRQVTVPQALELPFYHPSLEEGLKTALTNMEPERVTPQKVVLETA